MQEGRGFTKEGPRDGFLMESSFKPISFFIGDEDREARGMAARQKDFFVRYFSIIGFSSGETNEEGKEEECESKLF